jgi:N-acetylglucosamine-6-phosphate deacetylase
MCDAVKNIGKKRRGVLGLHIEVTDSPGKGAHIESYIHSPRGAGYRLLEYGKGVIKIITLAPEVLRKSVIFPMVLLFQQA